MRPGYDLLGLAHPLFPFKRILAEIPKDAPIGWFWNQFGPSREELKYMLGQGYTVFRPQMYWSDSHRIVPMEVLEKGLTELRDVVRDSNHEMKLYVSPSCEHAEGNAKEVQKRIDLVKKILPTAIPVNNPQSGKGAELKGVLSEHHGSNPGACDLASTDGDNIYDLDAAKWVRAYGNKEHPCFLWGARFNLREISDPGQSAPPIKDRKAAPDLTYFNSIKRLADPKGRAPKVDFKAKPFEAPNLWKTHAEDDQETSELEADEKRENRPVLIIDSSVAAVDILDSKQRTIGQLIRYGAVGSFPGKLTRYYSGYGKGIGLYGFQIGNVAKERTGSEYVWFKAGNIIYGQFSQRSERGPTGETSTLTLHTLRLKLHSLQRDRWIKCPVG